jgi:hypothetical protein
MKPREKTIPPDEMPHLTEALARLVQLYDATDNAVEADRYRKELATAKRPRKRRRSNKNDSWDITAMCRGRAKKTCTELGSDAVL